MVKAIPLFQPPDFEAFTDEALLPDRRSSMLAAIASNPQIADLAVDQAILLNVLRKARAEIYNDDPELRAIIEKLMERHNREKGRRYGDCQRELP